MGRLPLSPKVGYIGLCPVKHGGVSIDFQRARARARAGVRAGLMPAGVLPMLTVAASSWPRILVSSSGDVVLLELVDHSVLR